MEPIVAGFKVDEVARHISMNVATDEERKWWSDRSGIECKDVSMTDQSAAKEADINEIVRRFGVTGELPQRLDVEPIQGFVDIFDYQSARNALIEADRAFMSFPAALRARFDNDPQKVTDFLVDPANLDEAIKLGLAPPKPVPEPVKPA